MPGSELVTGQQRTWSLLQKLGEGDAGEVYRVESLIDRKIAILKRPRRSAFPSETIRQASQIEKEGLALGVLSRQNQAGAPLGAPLLLDQGKPGTQFTERFFIVMTAATGFNLGFLARVARFASVDLQQVPAAEGNLFPLERSFLESIAKLQKLPDLILLRCLAGLLEYLEAIHTLQTDIPTGRISGILWNDIKPEHCFWDPIQSGFTIIDWGNAQFLEADGITKDRQFSRMGDYQQFLNEMGHFISDFAPHLYQKLEWPEATTLSSIYTTGILPLKERLNGLLQEELLAMRQVRRAETELLQSASTSIRNLQELATIHRKIIAAGELPEQSIAEEYFQNLAQTLVVHNDLAQFRQLCEMTSQLPVHFSDSCILLQKIARICEAEAIPNDALLAGLNNDWPSVLWFLRKHFINQAEPDWWNELSEQIRSREIAPGTVRPWVALNRLLHALQSTASTNQDSCQELLLVLKNEIMPRWRQLEPDPPASDIQYRELQRIQSIGLACSTDANQVLNQALEQPVALIQIAVDAWERQDFNTAHRALRQALLWDPDRIRLFQADLAIHQAATWLSDVRAGMAENESLQDFVTRLELSGREIRNQVCPAGWLDALLNAFKQLRKGVEPPDLLVQYPEIRDDLSWLIAIEPRRPLLSSPGKLIRLERQAAKQLTPPALYGIKEALVGQSKGAISLSEPLDTWVPEARGSSARLFLGLLPSSSGDPLQVAIKLMRLDRVEYALPLFQEEVRILSLLRDVDGVIQMIECGFIQLDQNQLPPEEHSASAVGLSGSALRYGRDTLHNFLADLEKRVADGWLPYLAIERMNRQDNLLYLCDIGYTHGRFLPILDGLIIAIQICNILETAHARNIIYRDHKILHYYWQENQNGVFMIDWNIAKRFPTGLSDTDTQFDLVQFGARALHYIFAGRPAPGALPLGPNRPDEIEAASRVYAAQWTYDDQRLPKDIKTLLEAVLSGSYTTARQLRDALQMIYNRFVELAR